MKKTLFIGQMVLSFCLLACDDAQQPKNNASDGASLSQESQSPAPVGQSGVEDSTSKPNILQIAIGSADHSTLVAAVKAANLTDDLSNVGPFTLFAPTNAAFDKLPAGTVEDLLKPEKRQLLTDILGYHTYVGVIKQEYLRDGQELDMVLGGKVKISKQGDKTFVNGTPILASIEASNGLIYVIGDVLMPPSDTKK